jgi:hypothetical protein
LQRWLPPVLNHVGDIAYFHAPKYSPEERTYWPASNSVQFSQLPSRPLRGVHRPQNITVYPERGASVCVPELPLDISVSRLNSRRESSVSVPLISRNKIVCARLPRTCSIAEWIPGLSRNSSGTPFSLRHKSISTSPPQIFNAPRRNSTREASRVRRCGRVRNVRQ